MTVSSDYDAIFSSAKQLRECLSKSEKTYSRMESILNSFSERSTSLQKSMKTTEEQLLIYKRVNENVENSLQVTENIISYFDIARQVEVRIREDGARRDLENFLMCVDRLLKAVSFFERNSKFSSSESALKFNRALLEEAMVKLEQEFRNVLHANSKTENCQSLMDSIDYLGDFSRPLKPKSEAVEHVEKRKEDKNEKTLYLPDLLSSSTVEKLKAMAERLVNGGSASQCLKAYVEIRGSILEQNLKRMGVEKLTREEIAKFKWDELEPRLNAWIKHLKVAIMILFPAEKHLCDQILSKLSPKWDQAFAELSDSRASMLLSFGEAISRDKKTPEKLFALLDMYETLRDLLPQARLVFSQTSCSGIRESAEILLQRLAQAAKQTLSDFEDVVAHDSINKTPVANGSVHPLTSYVINYIKFLFEYHKTLQELYEEKNSSADAQTNKDGKPKLAVATSQILTALLSNLEAKSKQYKDPSLAHIFLMNNVHYMVQSVRESEAKNMLGDDWIRNQRILVKNHAKSYQRVAWEKIFNLLSTGSSSSENANRNAVKEKCKQFISLFEEIYQKQRQWTINNADLRSAVQVQVAEILLPAYRSFHSKSSSILEKDHSFGSSRSSKYLRYSVEEVEKCIGELFEGKSAA